MKIGVLALQGAFAEHVAVLRKLKADVAEVRLPEQLDGLNGLIIPGGESTTFHILMENYQFIGPLKSRIEDGLAVYGTCAGMIMLAKKLSDARGVVPVGVMDITVRRNAFGRQVDSFEADIPIAALGKSPFHCIFIRAPFIEDYDKERVDVLASLPDGTVVAARQRNMLVTSFHPELTEDARFHRYFLGMASGR